MDKPTITICMGSSCFAHGNEKNVAICESFLAAGGVRGRRRRSMIDQSKCVKCGKCIAVCPYHAIVKTTVPCE